MDKKDVMEEQIDDVDVRDVSEIESGIAGVINSLCRENDSNTPDFILGEFMVGCLDAFELASNKREVWFGVHLDILNDWEKLVMEALGEASMCWSETPKGVFDSTKAREIGERLLAALKTDIKT